MPIKLTWKSLAGLLSVIAGAIAAATAPGMPLAGSVTLIAIGGGVLAAERIADALDHATDARIAPTPTQTAAPAPFPTERTNPP